MIRQTQKAALAGTLGVLVAVGMSYGLLKSVIPLDFHVLALTLTAYVTAFLCGLLKRKESLVSDILYGFSVYVLTALLYLFATSFDYPPFDGASGNFVGIVFVLLVGSPVVILTSIPAVLVTIGLIRLFK